MWQTLQTEIAQGRKVLLLGIVGPLLALVPAIIFLPEIQSCISSLGKECVPISLILWAVLAGWPVTHCWSEALHERGAALAKQIDSVGGLNTNEKEQYKYRLPWIQAWLGIFERAFYVLLIGWDVQSGAAFIGVWIGLKVAGGWQNLSKGPLGRTVFYSGLLGNAMSVWFGVVAGLVLREYLHP